MQLDEPILIKIVRNFVEKEMTTPAPVLGSGVVILGPPNLADLLAKLALLKSTLELASVGCGPLLQIIEHWHFSYLIYCQ